MINGYRGSYSSHRKLAGYLNRNEKKYLKRLPSDVQGRVHDALDQTVDDPYEHVNKLKTSFNSSIFTYRVGEYRVVVNS